MLYQIFHTLSVEYFAKPIPAEIPIHVRTFFTVRLRLIQFFCIRISHMYYSSCPASDYNNRNCNKDQNKIKCENKQSSESTPSYPSYQCQIFPTNSGSKFGDSYKTQYKMDTNFGASPKKEQKLPASFVYPMMNPDYPTLVLTSPSSDSGISTDSERCFLVNIFRVTVHLF